MCAAYFFSVRNATNTKLNPPRQGRMLLENLPAAHVERIHTDSNLMVKLHKKKRNVPSLRLLLSPPRSVNENPRASP